MATSLERKLFKKINLVLHSGCAEGLGKYIYFLGYCFIYFTLCFISDLILFGAVCCWVIITNKILNQILSEEVKKISKWTGFKKIRPKKQQDRKNKIKSHWILITPPPPPPKKKENLEQNQYCWLYICLYKKSAQKYYLVSMWICFKNFVVCVRERERENVLL